MNVRHDNRPWLRPTFQLKVLLVIPSLVALFGLLNHHLVLTPSVSYRYRPGHDTRVISPTTPSTLIRSADPLLRWRLTTESLPFYVVVPRAIDAVRIRGRLQPGSQPVAWLKAEGAKDADMRSLVYSAFLDSLDWKQVSDGTMTLWMRDKRETSETVSEGSGKEKTERTRTWTKDIPQYTSVQNFFDNPPDLGSVASLGIDRLALSNMNGVEMPSEGVSLPQVLRGSHQFYVYAQTGELKISFDKIDRNRGKDADIVDVRIARSDQLTMRNPRWVKTSRIKDDGNVGNSGPKGNPQAFELVIRVAKPGAYYVELETSEDVLITNLTPSSPMLSFSGRVFFAEGPAYGEKDFRTITLLTNGTTLSLAAAHEQGKQDLTVVGKKYSLKGVNVETKIEGLKGMTSFDLGRPDIKISTNGLLTIAPAKSFPSAGTIPLDLANANLNDADYVLAAYQPSPNKTVSFDQTFSWPELDLKGKRLNFAIEVPGLIAANSSIGLSELQATLIRGPFPWGKIGRRPLEG